MDEALELQMSVRQFQYYPAANPKGLVDLDLALPVESTAFVGLHTWSVGFPGGPAFPYERLQVAGGTREHNALAAQIVYEQIAPALEAARAVGLLYCQVEPRRVAEKYPQHRYLLDNPNGADEPSPSVAGDLPEALPGFRRHRGDAVHGPNYRDWDGWEAMDIAPPVRPRPEDPVIVTAAQFDRILRERGVVNLIYAGFHTNMCILHSPAGMRDMAAYGYRCILLREATLAVEYPDTMENLDMTRTAIRFVEHTVGYSASVKDFIAACSVVPSRVAAHVVS